MADEGRLPVGQQLRILAPGFGASWALLAAYLLAAALGTWQSCLLVTDGAVFLSSVWLGSAWDLFFDQIAGRAVSTFFQFGLAWLLRPAFGSSTQGFLAVAHILYFAAPLVLWLVVRAVEPQRIYSRLLLAITLPLITQEQWPSRATNQRQKRVPRAEPQIAPRRNSARSRSCRLIAACC